MKKKIANITVGAVLFVGGFIGLYLASKSEDQTKWAIWPDKNLKQGSVMLEKQYTEPSVRKLDFGDGDFYISSITAEHIINSNGVPAIHTTLTVNGLTVGTTNYVMASLDLGDTNGFDQVWSFQAQFEATNAIQVVSFTKAQAIYQGNVFFRIKQLP